MKKSNLKQMVNEFRDFAVKKSPEILTGLGIAGMITATVFAVEATPKAIRLLNEKKEEIAMGNEECELTKKEVVETVWKCYIPTAVMSTISIGCLIGACSVNTRRNAALAAAYSLSDTAFREYKEKVIETIGENKEKTVMDNISKDRVEKDPMHKTTVLVTGKGDTLCYDITSARYFMFDIEKIRKIENELNSRLLRENYVSLNELYDALYIDHTSLGYDVGWNVSDGLIDMYFSYQMMDDTPCVVINHKNPPKHGYMKMM